MDDSIDISTTHTNKKARLSNQCRQSIYEALLAQSHNGKLNRGAVFMVANSFSASIKTVRRIWKQVESASSNGVVDVSNNLIGRVGRKRVQLDPNKITEIPLRRRTNIRSMANALGVAKSTLHRRIKEGVVRAHSNALKPSLTDENMKSRLKFCLSMIEPSSINNTPTFKNMLNCVHIDEKWFYMTKEAQKYYLLPGEKEPLRTCKSKRFITKVMFLVAVARPTFGTSSNQEFDGKIGIFPFTFKEPARRTSKNRVAGTLETKSITSVTKDVVRECLIHKVLPAIRAKWPTDRRGETIYIQQDNAKPHIKPDDIEFLQAASSDGFDIRLSFQPPNSPDLNVLDLGFFRAIQSLQHQEAPNSIDELLQAVEKAFNDLSSQTLNYIFLTYQSCMIEVMKIYGGIGYKIPHMGKDSLSRHGNLPFQLQLDNEAVKNALNHLEH